MKLPVRKPNRLPTYDYRSGGYFVTICTQNHKQMFWDNRTNADCTHRGEHCSPGVCPPTARKDVCTRRGEHCSPAPLYTLNPYGQIVDACIQKIGDIYPAVSVEKYVIMPNHVHLIVLIQLDENGRAMLAPTISEVVRQFKGAVTKQIGFPIWQKSFYDHVIRNEADFIEKWRYIDNNPLQWELDELYIQ